MVDQADLRIAKRLAERHYYPFAENIYTDIFKAFSHFPLPLRKLGIKGEGDTITLIALSVQNCFEIGKKDFDDLFETVLGKIKPLAGNLYPQDVTVDVLLGCFLYYFHPSEIRNQLASYDAKQRLNEKQRYEFDLKKKTVCIYIV